MLFLCIFGGVSLFLILMRYFVKGNSGMLRAKKDLKGKVILITGLKNLNDRR